MVRNKTTLMAFNAMALLAKLEPGQHMGAGAIAEETGVAQNYLGKILQTLAKAGLLESQKGLGGGFALAQPAGEISLYDVARQFETLDRWKECFLGFRTCDEGRPCPMHDEFAPLREAYVALLKERTIADMAKGLPEVEA